MRASDDKTEIPEYDGKSEPLFFVKYMPPLSEEAVARAIEAAKKSMRNPPKRFRFFEKIRNLFSGGTQPLATNGADERGSFE